MKYQEEEIDGRVERKIKHIKWFLYLIHLWKSTKLNAFESKYTHSKENPRMHCKVFFVCFLINISSKECISCLTLLKACMQEEKQERDCEGRGEMARWTRKRKQHTQTWCFTNVWTHHWRGMEVFKVAATRWLLAQRNTYTQLKRSLKKYTLCGSSPLVSAYRILVPAFVAKASAQRTARRERQKMDLSEARCSINET